MSFHKSCFEQKITFTKDELQMIRIIVNDSNLPTQNEIRSKFGYPKAKKFYDKIGTIEDPDVRTPYTTPDWLKDD